MEITSQDWKYLSKLKETLLNRLCDRINSKSMSILNDSTKSHYEKYIALYKHIEKSDRMIADGFNNWKRSQAFICLTFCKKHKLITDNEYNELSDNTKKVVAFYLGETE